MKQMRAYVVRGFAMNNEDRNYRISLEYDENITKEKGGIQWLLGLRI